MRIGIISCNKFKNRIDDDIALKNILIDNGIETSIISWEEENDYDMYDMFILRSVWGYQDKYLEFKDWLSVMDSKTLYNSTEIIRNNIRKNIQFGILDKHDIPHIKTTFSRNLGIIDSNVGNVVKPIISGSGNNTYIIDRTNSQEIKEIFSSIINVYDNGLMIQPLMDVSNGEYACIYINGINVYNMLRFPGIFGEKKKPVYLETIPNDVKNLADRVNAIPEYQGYLYMRVDILKDQGKVYIMEVELAEPDLMIKYVPDKNVRTDSMKTLIKSIGVIK